jgi:N-acetylglucosaminyldiphosphoundecaprenol N-acetyl-beta-D-mannosaminyltransferase
MSDSIGAGGARAGRVGLSGIEIDALTEADVVQAVRQAWAEGQGGSIITVNVDIARAAKRDKELAEIIANGSLVVADGMPIVWAVRLQGDDLPERVAGSSLMYSLSEAAAADGRSIYVLGGEEGVPERAAIALAAKHRDLRIAGTQSPKFGFAKSPDGIRRVISEVTPQQPDLVFVGLGFPLQEKLIEQLRVELPRAWFIGCGGGIAMAAGVFARAHPIMQRLGLEWCHRLLLEPRRLARRYLLDDAPFAIALLTRAAARRVRRFLRCSPGPRLQELR